MVLCQAPAGSRRRARGVSDRWPDDRPPRFLFLDTNQHCNLKCRHCMYWTREEIERPGHISVERRAELIEEFGELNPGGTVVVCGGESMLNPERYFPITRQCRDLGLRCMSVVNGTRITNEAEALRMIDEGPSEITVSLNSHRPEIHDDTRGMQGAWALAVGALELLVEARARRAAPTALYAMAVVCEANYRELDAFYDFVLNEVRADKLKLNFLQPTFGPVAHMKEDKFYRDNVIRDVDGLRRILEACDRKYDLGLNEEWLDVVSLYHRSVHANGDAARGWAARGTEKPICNSYERNIMVDMFGKARFCFSTGFPGTKLEKRGDMRRFWYGNRALRKRMAACTQYCGISHSVRRVSATAAPESPPSPS